MRCLAWIAPPGGIDLVAPLIHDPSPEVRAEAVAAIGRLGDEDAAMLLFELLGDESELIQESAMGALARMPPERVVPAAAAGPGQPGRARARARGGDAGAACATPPPPPPSSRCRATRARRVRAAAALKALGEMEAPGVLDLLRAALRDESSLVRQQAVLSLGKREEPEPRGAPPAPPRRRRTRACAS